MTNSYGQNGKKLKFIYWSPVNGKVSFWGDFKTRSSTAWSVIHFQITRMPWRTIHLAVLVSKWGPFYSKVHMNTGNEIHLLLESKHICDRRALFEDTQHVDFIHDHMQRMPRAAEKHRQMNDYEKLFDHALSIQPKILQMWKWKQMVNSGNSGTKIRQNFLVRHFKILGILYEMSSFLEIFENVDPFLIGNFQKS